jgi:hypothetical protein
LSSIFYNDLLWWDGHQHRGIAKSHGHQIYIEVAPVICGHHVEECELCPELEVATIREKFGGLRDMSHEEIVDAERVLSDLVPN